MPIQAHLGLVDQSLRILVIKIWTHLGLLVFFCQDFKSFYWLGLHIRQRSFFVLIRENALSIFCRHNVAAGAARAAQKWRARNSLLSPLLGLTVVAAAAPIIITLQKRPGTEKISSKTIVLVPK